MEHCGLGLESYPVGLIVPARETFFADIYNSLIINCIILYQILEPLLAAGFKVDPCVILA